MTSTDQEGVTNNNTKCSLTSLISMSCRGRAEAFARSLQSRLSSLGAQQNGNGTSATCSPPVPLLASSSSPPDETSWLTSSVHSHVGADNNKSITLSQPRTSSSDSELFFDLSLLESPPTTTNISPIPDDLNHDNLQLLPHKEDCHCVIIGNAKNSNKNNNNSNNNSIIDSDSSDIFYDIENDAPLDSNLDLNKTDDKPELTDDNRVDENDVPLDNDHRLNFNNKAESLNDENRENDANNDDDDDDNDDNERLPRVRRCSSLKTGKTPPGTPGRKKIVRFADVLGLDLADVRTFLDEIPKIPTSAYDDLKDVVDCGNNGGIISNNIVNSRIDKILMPLFQQPGGLTNFLDRVRDHFVCLENALVKDPLELSIIGTVRVRNLDYHKSVYIRYTLDLWETYVEIRANYLENSCDGFSDKFTFLIYTHTLNIGQRIEFAIRFQCKGCQYWDNNNGVNYCFQCLPSTNPTNCFRPIADGGNDGGLDENWPASFYY